MITIDLNVAIAGFLSFSLLLVFGIWIFYNFNNMEKKENVNILQCPYCTHLFPEQKTDLLRCPFCKSIIDETELKENL